MYHALSVEMTPQFFFFLSLVTLTFNLTIHLAQARDQTRPRCEFDTDPLAIPEMFHRQQKIRMKKSHSAKTQPPYLLVVNTSITMSVRKAAYCVCMSCVLAEADLERVTTRKTASSQLNVSLGFGSTASSKIYRYIGWFAFRKILFNYRTIQ